MVVKSPFLSERDQGLAFLTRNEGALRGLTSLFPAARLAVVAEIVSLAGRKKLLAGQVRVRTEKGTSRSRASSLVTVAARMIHNDIDLSMPYATCQLYMNLCCDMRVLQNVGREYLVHSYGRPLQFIQRFCDKELPFGHDKDLSLRYYLLDRLLFEDGDYILATLEVISESSGYLNSKEAGSRVRNLVFERLGERILSQKLPHSIKSHLVEKTRYHQRRVGKMDRRLRRTALEYTVRRDWLSSLGLVLIDGKIPRLTSQGEALLHGLRKTSLNQGFFEADSFSLISSVYSSSKAGKLDRLQALERVYEAMVASEPSILETLVLINTTILLYLPNFLGNRIELLQDLRRAIQDGSTSLLFQNGYRTRDYFVRARR